ncbi:MAG TPA: sigma factor-like helix-turn-helix DNA-binding protein [Acidimicrobiales bacterium]|nr:sigma factor-like helix-turn-helix DNA-binding protein [Acidimicrobiales bacterium]
MSAFVWPSDDGWPYPDEDAGPADPRAQVDDEALCVAGLPDRLLDGLEPLERAVVAARFGVGGRPSRTLRQLSRETGVSRRELRTAMATGLAKLRSRLS